AARAGTSTPYWSGSDEAALAGVGWYIGNRGDHMVPVGMGPTGAPAPNPWGLHGVHGGVREWCQDVRADNWAEGPNDDSPRTQGIERRIIRGGAFDLPAWSSLSGARLWYPQGCHYPNMGLRPSRAAR
ncbi:MAG: SUMF1/EgtB/PvdO family nonheme iron enzyme, partial [bacterium]|nr:SUMF1/EgtB/PvdO family nonheme iron enzyme [bacterium]